MSGSLYLLNVGIILITQTLSEHKPNSTFLIMKFLCTIEDVAKLGLFYINLIPEFDDHSARCENEGKLLKIALGNFHHYHLQSRL